MFVPLGHKSTLWKLKGVKLGKPQWFNPETPKETPKWGKTCPVPKIVGIRHRLGVQGNPKNPFKAK